MKQFKTMILGIFILLSTGLYANSVNMAPIITYLLSSTTSLDASNFTMTLDVNETTVTGDWKSLSNVNDVETTATVLTQGDYGVFHVIDNTLYYQKTIETNATDSGILEIIDETDTVVEINVAIASLYWKQASAGSNHTVAIKSNGTLWAWGRNDNGQLGDGTTDDKWVPTQEITKSTDWIEVDSGASHTMAIKSNGTLWAWGSNTIGVLGVGTTDDKWVPTQEISKSTNWETVSSRVYHTVGIKSDGTLWAWGSNYDGQLGDGTTGNKSVPTQEVTGSTNWTDVSTGSSHTVAIKSNGTLWAWGSNTVGELGDGTTDDKWVPTQEDTNATDWSIVSAGASHTVAIKLDGTLWAWGANAYGQLGDGTNVHKSIPTQEDSNTTDWSMVNAGSYYTAAVKSDGTLWAWGRNTVGELGDGTTDDKWIPTQEITESTDWIEVDSGDSYGHTVVIKSDGTLWAWGHNEYGELGNGTINGSLVPIQLYPREYFIMTASSFMMPELDINKTTVTGDWKILSLVNDPEATAGVKVQGDYGVFHIIDNTLYYEKNIETNATDSGILEITNWTYTVEINVTVESLYWKQVSAGGSHTVAIKSDGTMWSWGANHYGQLGDGTTDHKSLPTQEDTNATDWSFVFAGGNDHTVAIKTNGTLWAWGHNNYGQLGNGTTDDRWVPTQEDTNATDWSIVSAGEAHTVAIKSSGTLWAWGLNAFGQLGDGTTDHKSIPTREDTNATDWTTVTTGQYNTAATKSNGTLWAWGHNNYGQLGDGTTDDKWVPTQEDTNATDWSIVSAGVYYTAAIKSNGTLWSWGRNSSGQLGDDTNISKLFPTQELTESTDWTNLSTGYGHTVAIKSDGTLWAWGWNTSGQLGDGTSNNKLVPTQEITGSTEWNAISAGNSHTTAIKSNSIIWAWGTNYYGQLGDGTTNNSWVPINPQPRQP